MVQEGIDQAKSPWEWNLTYTLMCSRIAQNDKRYLVLCFEIVSNSLEMNKTDMWCLIVYQMQLQNVQAFQYVVFCTHTAKEPKSSSSRRVEKSFHVQWRRKRMAVLKWNHRHFLPVTFVLDLRKAWGHQSPTKPLEINHRKEKGIIGCTNTKTKYKTQDRDIESVFYRCNILHRALGKVLFHRNIPWSKRQ